MSKIVNKNVHNFIEFSFFEVCGFEHIVSLFVLEFLRSMFRLL